MPINTIKLISQVILLLLSCGHLTAGGTNGPFVTLDENYRVISNSNSWSKESLPASQFPEGNWGTVSNGMQVSLRLNKNEYTNGEPMMATILARNVGYKPLFYVSIYMSGTDGPIRFFVTTQDNRDVEPVWGDMSPLGGGEIPVGCQRKFEERFDMGYHLTNGNFFVQAYMMQVGRRAYITSAKVPIKVVSSR